MGDALSMIEALFQQRKSFSLRLLYYPRNLLLAPDEISYYG